jgi:hypothetical protein
MKIYVASSWRNIVMQQVVVNALRKDGHEVYDFTSPAVGVAGFSWQQVDEDRSWLKEPTRFREGLQHPVAQDGFARDMEALRACDACVLVLPCGRSAHLELGWACGAGKRAVVLLDAPVSEPELMYLACEICVSLEEVVGTLRVLTVGAK